MRSILASNILEHARFPSFMRDVLAKHANSTLLVTGDLLNVFPEPGEDLRGSMFFELYGDVIESGLEQLVEDHFKHVAQSPLIPHLRDMFMPMGRGYRLAQQMAKARYEKLFAAYQGPMVFIPGNMDYPWVRNRLRTDIVQLDVDCISIDGVKIGGLGGIPNTAHPFRGVVEISPYEMHEQKYRRRLGLLNGVDVLMTHLSPQEFPPLMDFLRDTPLQVLICRAPFDFNRKGDFRGALEVQHVGEKQVIYVRPFDVPVNHYFVLESDGPRKFGIIEETWRLNSA